MGLTLSEPATAKDTACCQNATFKVGSSCMQGWRVKMEDAHTHILSLPDDPGTAFFAVFDGHGGAKVAEYAGRHLHKYVTARDEYKEGDVAEALRQAFLEIDEAMLTEESLREEQAGCTAVTMVVKDNTVWCANVGDSRAVASVKGVPEPLSLDHKPNNEIEFNRITAAGGFVEYNRVNGNLALSRALGDYVFKRNEKKGPQEQMVTAFPDIEQRRFGMDWEFIVMACDGIWDVMTNYEVVEYVRQNIAEGVEPEEICENLMMKCLAPDCQMAGLGCDNMTVVIIVLLQGRTYEELQKCCGTTYQRKTSEVESTKQRDSIIKKNTENAAHKSPKKMSGAAESSPANENFGPPLPMPFVHVAAGHHEFTPEDEQQSDTAQQQAPNEDESQSISPTNSDEVRLIPQSPTADTEGGVPPLLALLPMPEDAQAPDSNILEQLLSQNPDHNAPWVSTMLSKTRITLHYIHFKTQTISFLVRLIVKELARCILLKYLCQCGVYATNFTPFGVWLTIISTYCAYSHTNGLQNTFNFLHVI